MKRPLIYAALAVLALSAPAVAQSYGPGGYERGALPPYEILTILRSTGLDPLGQPVRRGPNYVLRAVDDTDREVSVVVSARSGQVLSVTPVQTASRMPPGYIPPDAYRPAPRGPYGPPVVDDEDDDESRWTAPPRSSPPPRGGAMRPADDNDDILRSEPNVITANPDRSGMLPPPPERFPQRVAPPAQAKPKPVTRAAAAPPKTAPLPKPKPAVNSEAPAAPAPQAWPSAAAPTPAPDRAPAADETPH